MSSIDLKSPPRSSNIELLRIVATLFILILHCNGWLLNDANFGGQSWQSGDVYAQIFRPIIQAITVVGVNIFILISGFFSIKPKWKSLINLFSILCFFYVGTYLYACYIGKSKFGYWALLTQMMAFSRESWFIQCYLFLMLLSPILNAFVRTISKKNFRNYLLLFIVLTTYFSCVHNSTYFYFNRGYSVTCFILLYLIGRYIKLYLIDDLKKYSSSFIWGGYILTTLVVAILYYTKLNVDWVQYCSPFVILPSVLLFVLFERIKLQSKFINWVGSSCLAVFILHTCHPILSMIADVNLKLFIGNGYGLYVLKMFPVILGVFVFAILLDKIRCVLMRPILNRMPKNLRFL